MTIRKGKARLNDPQKIKPLPCKCGGRPMVVEEEKYCYLYCHNCEKKFNHMKKGQHADMVAVEIVKKRNGAVNL